MNFYQLNTPVWPAPKSPPTWPLPAITPPPKDNRHPDF